MTQLRHYLGVYCHLLYGIPRDWRICSYVHFCNADQSFGLSMHEGGTMTLIPGHTEVWHSIVKIRDGLKLDHV